MNGDEDPLRLFAEWQRMRNLSEDSTVIKYQQTLRRWLESLAHNGRTLADATRADVLEFVTLDLSARSRAAYLSRLDVFYRWLIDEELASSNPAARVPRPRRPDTVPRPISTADLDVAFRSAPPRTRAFMALAAFAGLRCKEIAGLRRDDVLDTVDPGVLVVSSPKGHRERIVPLHDQVVTALRLFGLPRLGFVFQWWEHPERQIRPHTVSHEINKHLHGLGIASTAHTLRAWFATNLYRQTLDLRLVQELLGHRDPATTTIYVALVPGKAADAVAQLALV